VSWLSEQQQLPIPTSGITLLTAAVDSWEEFTTAHIKCQLFPKQLKK